MLCVGEVLWDALPAGLFLGGAPFNVAYHLRRLGQPADLLSRVGDDVLGREACRRLSAAGLDPAWVQRDAVLPTGFVGVELDEQGVAGYTIHEPVAWDALEPVGFAESEAPAAIVYGSLAQRSQRSRETIHALLRTETTAVFDVNLRPPYVEVDVVRTSLQRADWVKLNEEEVGLVGGWFMGPAPYSEAVPAIAERFGCRLICVTRGGEGAALWHEGRWTHHPGYPTDVSDTVGAGDAFLAGLLSGLLEGVGDERALDRGCRLGSFVASRPGPTPPYDLSRQFPTWR